MKLIQNWDDQDKAKLLNRILEIIGEKEYLDIVSKAFSEDKVTSRGGKIRITFKDKNKYRSYGQILNKIPKDGGKQPMKISNAKSNTHGEISSAELVFTNQFLKSTLKLKTLPAKPF